MAKLNNLKQLPSVLLDTDVVVNWLIKEVESQTAKELWKSPYKIISFIEDRKLRGLICLTTLLEIRFLLRRKRNFTDQQIENFINEITGIFEVVVPDEISLLEANKLQSKERLDPFDTILLAVSIVSEFNVLISRDRSFLKIASFHISVYTPEDFLKQYNSSIEDFSA
ncbi:MAG: PIN domain-containing protein [Candidatus Omnitrophica bacterium]|nr:PIN domain-containing protein [Candidatus Omnitrophota bacterium]